MKVLIIGGDEFIATHIAKRFYKEEYDIHIINKDYKKNIKIKHKLYETNIDEEECEYIFLDNDFSTVIYIPNFYSERNEMECLSNALKYSDKYNVESFIYLSSTDIYEVNGRKLISEEDIITCEKDNQIDLYSYEEYCKLYNEKSDMNVVCLRMSKIYGPGNNLNDSVCDITKFIKKCDNINIISKEDISKLEEKNDYLYIGDAVDAIYKASKSRINNVLNISTNNIFSNQKAKTELNWNVKYTLKEGIEKTVKWKIENEKSLKNKIKLLIVKEKKTKSIIRPYIDNLMILVLVVLVNLYLNKRGINSNIDINILYIFAVAAVYGTNQSCIAVAAASLLSIFLRMENGENIIQIIYDTNTIFKIISYVFFGIVMGYIIDKKNNDEQKFKNEINALTEKFDFIHNLYKENRIIRKELENQIVNQEDSLGKLFTITEKLNVLYPETIFDVAVEIVSEIMDTDEVSIYLLPKEQSYLRLIAQSEDAEVNKSINLLDHRDMEAKILNNKIFVNKDFIDDLPMMAAPIIIENEVKGVICLSNVEFEDVTLYRENLLTITSRLISGALSRAYTYEEAILNEKYIENTEILQCEYFKKIIEEKEEMGNLENNMLLKVISGDYELVKKYTRSVDSIGINREGKLFVLVSNTNNHEIVHVMNRLESCGVKTELKDFKIILDENNYMEECACS